LNASDLRRLTLGPDQNRRKSSPRLDLEAGRLLVPGENPFRIAAAEHQVFRCFDARQDPGR
jgi:hypothetical protein